MTKEEFDKFEHEAHEYLKARQDILINEYGMGKYERWDYDQATGELIFSDKGIAKLITKFQAVGSLSKISKTWLWSWANPSILENVKNEIYQVKEFGEQLGLKELTTAKWKADEIDAWAMTNITGRILEAKGAYRCPDETGYLFVVFTDVQRVSEEAHTK